MSAHLPATFQEDFYRIHPTGNIQNPLDVAWVIEMLPYLRAEDQLIDALTVNPKQLAIIRKVIQVWLRDTSDDTETHPICNAFSAYGIPINCCACITHTNLLADCLNSYMLKRAIKRKHED